jgi:hypothetical protein
MWTAAKARVTDRPDEDCHAESALRVVLRARPAALAGGLTAFNRASARSATPEPAAVCIDGGGERAIEVSMPTLRTLPNGDGYGEHLLEFQCATQGLSLFSSTFG